MEIHLGEQKLKNIWVKVTGMLQQNWAFIDADQTPIVIYFFDDNKMIFDQLEFESNDVAISGLRWNGFSNAWENKELFQNRFIYGEMTKIYKKRSSHHKPYSSGNYWKQPPDGFIEELETVSVNKSYSIEDITSEKTKHLKSKDVEIDPEEERIKKLLTQKVGWDYTDTSAFETLPTPLQESIRTRDRIRYAEAKAQIKFKKGSRSRKLRSFDDQ